MRPLSAEEIEAGNRLFEEEVANGSQDGHTMPDNFWSRVVRDKRGDGSLELLDQKPPSDRNAELAVVGRLIIEPAFIPECNLYDTHFVDDNARDVYSTLRRMSNDGELIDLPHVVERLKADGHYDCIGGAAFLAEAIHNNEASPSRFQEYVERLKSIEQRRRCLFAALTTIKAVHSQQPTAELLADVHAQFEVLASDSVSQKLIYPALTCRELFESRDVVTYYVNNVLAADQPCIVAAPQKCLKTSIILDLGISLATGTPFLGEAEVPEPVRVGLMSGESGMAVIRSNLIAICEARGLELSDVGGMVFSDKLTKFGNVEHALAIREYIGRHELKVLIVDPAYLSMPGADAGNLFVQGELLGSMNDICTSAGVTMVLVHHTRKNNADPFAVPELEDIAWSGFQEWARQWLLIRRRERYEVGSGIHRLWLNCGGSAGHQFLRALEINEGTKDSRQWLVSLQQAEAARQEVERRTEIAKEVSQAKTAKRELQRVLTALDDLPAGETKTGLSAATGLNGTRLLTAIGLGLKQGLIEACEVTKNKRSHEAYQLTEAGRNRPYPDTLTHPVNSKVSEWVY